jgi:hypothetical protein
MIHHRRQRPSLPFRSDEEAVREREGGGGSGDEKEEQREGERGSRSGGKRE